MTQQKHKLILLAVALLALFSSYMPSVSPAVFAAASTIPLSDQSTDVDTSYNWAGYVAATGPYSGVGATWTIPAPAQSSALAADATWVGIGGVNTEALIQAGTQAIHEDNGQENYFAWYELLPGGMVQVPLTVAPGDSVTISLAENSGNEWAINFRDNTTGQTYQKNMNYDAGDNATAEWIQEMPTLANSNDFIGLDNFGSVKFIGGYAVRNGITEDIAQTAAEPITMLGSGNGSNQEALAVPSALGSDGASFTISRTSVTTPSSVVDVSPEVHVRWHRTGTGINNPRDFERSFQTNTNGSQQFSYTFHFQF